MDVISQIAEFIDPISLVLLIVIFWLMKQNGQLVDQTFTAVGNTAKLTGLLESLIGKMNGH